MATVRIEGVDRLVEKLDKLGKLDGAAAVMKAAAEYLRDKFLALPPATRLTRSEVYGTSFKSVRQQRFFFAGLQDGSIEVPYHRGESPGSKDLPGAWTIKAEDRGLSQTIGNDTSYGPFVMGEKQSMFMQRVGWRKVGDLVAAERETLTEKIKESLEREIVKGSE